MLAFHMTNRIRRLWFLAAGLALVFLPLVRAELRVVGTDLLGVDFSKALYDFAGRHDLKLALAFDGSRSGLDQLRAGRADLVLFVLPPDEAAGLVGCESVVLAFHRVVILVPPGAPLAKVSLDQLGGIFGAGGPASYARWGELGVAGDWSGSAILPHAPVAGFGIVSDFFRHAVLRDRNFKANVVRYESAADLPVLFAGDSRAIVLASAPPSKPGVAKLVPVALRPDEPAFLPTPENLRSGDYPLRLPLCIAFRRESALPLLPLVRYLFSDELVIQLERAQVVPLPVAARRQQVAALEKL